MNITATYQSKRRPEKQVTVITVEGLRVQLRDTKTNRKTWIDSKRFRSDYVEVDSPVVAKTEQTGISLCNRCVVVVDRGWIFAGDVTETNDRIRLSRALWLFRWERIGFAAVVSNPLQTGVDIRPINDVDIPAGSEVYRIRVADDWGIK